MACELAEFLEHNPGEVDVVRLNSDRWTEDHKVMMEALTEGVRIFLRRRGHLSFEQLLYDFQECQSCAVSGTLQASLLYGQEQGIYLDNNGKLKMDAKGLILTKARARRRGRRCRLRRRARRRRHVRMEVLRREMRTHSHRRSEPRGE